MLPVSGFDKECMGRMTCSFTALATVFQSNGVDENLCALELHVSELQIKGGIEDNSKDNFSYFSMKTYVVTPH